MILSKAKIKLIKQIVRRVEKNNSEIGQNRRYQDVVDPIWLVSNRAIGRVGFVGLIKLCTKSVNGKNPTWLVAAATASTFIPKFCINART